MSRCAVLALSEDSGEQILMPKSRHHNPIRFKKSAPAFSNTAAHPTLSAISREEYFGCIHVKFDE